nr:hypothetical protein [Tanacetum cinerariifolium]
MLNNIMAAGSKDRPPMLVTGRYAQWQSRFSRYIDIRPNGDALRKCILEAPYIPFTVTIPAKEAIHLLLNEIGDEIYPTVDACKTAHDMWIAIQRLQQGESLNIQDVKTNLFGKFGKFTSHDGESMKSNASTKYNGKDIAKPIIPPSESASEEDSDPKQAQRDKDMQKNLALIAKYFKKIYKPTNNNLITSSNSRNKNVDTSSRYKNDNQTGQFGNQRIMTVVGAKETVGSQETKRAKDYTYHKEKMLLCKQADKDVSFKAEKANWLEDTDE